MLSKRVGDPCPRCTSVLIRRRSNFRLIAGDVAYCAPCNAAYEITEEDALPLFGPFLPSAVSGAI